jgi:coenzyme F420-reducing hydrogenase delta subunit
LEEIGLENQRLQMADVSAAMGSQFVTAAKEMYENIKILGPNPLKES